MSTAIKLQADAAYGCKGQYIARITGRDAKYTFARTFIGRKEGKRGDATVALIDVPGLYEICDVGTRGKQSFFRLILSQASAEGAGLGKFNASETDALLIARQLEDGIALDQIAHATGWGSGDWEMGPQAPTPAPTPQEPESEQDEIAVDVTSLSSDQLRRLLAAALAEMATRGETRV